MICSNLRRGNGSDGSDGGDGVQGTSDHPELLCSWLSVGGRTLRFRGAKLALGRGACANTAGSRMRHSQPDCAL
jgi:hypothetical protein